MEKDYIEVTRKNIKGIMAESKRSVRGRLLIAEPGCNSFSNSIVDANIDLWNSPIFDSENSFYIRRGSTKKNGKDWQTNWGMDRSYLLRPIPNPTGDEEWDYCRESFDKLITGSYEFKIGFQSVNGRGGIFPTNGITLYFPKTVSIESAFRNALSHMIRRINKTIEKEALQFTPLKKEYEERIVQYALADYENGEIFRKNVKAGLDADEYLF